MLVKSNRTRVLLLIVAVAAILFCVAAVALGPWFRTGLEMGSASPVVGGMQVAVRSVGREHHQLHFTYTFRWVGWQRDFVFIRPWGGINVYFWDSDGRQMEDVSFVRYGLSEGFAKGEGGVFEGTASVEVPAGAESFAVELGRSGIVTQRVTIPR